MAGTAHNGDTDEATREVIMADTGEHMVVDEMAARRARFGKLPPRIAPDEQVESADTDSPRGVPDHLGDPQEWAQLRYGAGIG